jgi:ankyrin repeat protein
VVKRLLEAGADIDFNAWGPGTALIIAARNGHDQVVKRLLEAGADIEAKGWEGTALIVAAQKGHDEVVKRLLEAGATNIEPDSEFRINDSTDNVLAETANSCKAQ